MKPISHSFTLLQASVAVVVLGLVGALAVLRAGTHLFHSVRSSVAIPDQLDPRRSHV